MLPHKENLCYIGCKISFVTIYALCREMCFVAIYALLCGEKIIKKFSMLRKNDKYEVCAQINGLWEKQQIWSRYSQEGWFEILKINEHFMYQIDRANGFNWAYFSGIKSNDLLVYASTLGPKCANFLLQNSTQCQVNLNEWNRTESF